MHGYKLLAYGKNKVDLTYGEEVIGFRIVTTEDESKRKDFRFLCLGQHEVDYNIADYTDLTWILLHECDDKSGGALYWQPHSGSTTPAQTKVDWRTGDATSQPRKRRSRKRSTKKSTKQKR